MAAKKASMGTTCWYSPDGSTWSRDRTLANGINLWRIGNPEDVAALAGKVIRGWTIRGTVNGPLRRAFELLGLQGVVHPQPGQIISAPTRDLNLVRADNGRPVGAIPSGGSFATVGSPEWVGLFTTDFVTRRESDAIPYPTITEFTLLVSPKPRWRVEAPPEVEVGQAVEVRVHVSYPDGEKVAGLPLVLGSGGGKTEVRGTSGNFGPTGTALTNAEGVATFRVRGVHGGMDPMWVADSPHRDLREPMFEPPLPGTFQLSVRALPTEVPPEDCVVIPEIAEIPEIPGRIEWEPTYRWDAGANSVDELDGDLRVAFDQGYAMGCAIGLTHTRDGVGTLERLTHAFYFHTTAAGQYLVAVMESGKTVSNAMPHVATAQYEILRVGGVVSYLVNDEVVYRSRVPSTGTVLVGSALYGTGDTAP